jgi:hypothetical protein
MSKKLINNNINDSNIKKNLYIFTKKNNNSNSKLIPFKIRKFDSGEIKFLPAVSKEWKNTIYTFNSNNLKNFPVYDLNINSLIKSYFNSQFMFKFIHNKYKPRWRKRFAMNKIYVSKAEIKHTNSKALLTIYTYNREKISLLKKLRSLRSSSVNYVKFFIKVFLKELIVFKDFFKNYNGLINDPNRTAIEYTLKQMPFLWKVRKIILSFIIESKNRRRKRNKKIKPIYRRIEPLLKEIKQRIDNLEKKSPGTMEKVRKSLSISRGNLEIAISTGFKFTNWKKKNQTISIENRAFLEILYLKNSEKIIKNILEKVRYKKISSFYFILRRFEFLFPKSKKFSVGTSSLSSILKKMIKALFFKELVLFRKYKLRFSLNKSKFEEKFLYILGSLISKYYNKKVEFNIVNLRSIVLNSDLFTYILTLKLKKTKTNIIRMMNIILNRAALPQVNRILERSPLVKSVDFNLLENRYKNTNISSILGLAEKKMPVSKDQFTLEKLLYNIYPSAFLNKEELVDFITGKKNALNNTGSALINKSYDKIYENLFNSIKYKNMGGIRLEISGRLTKRYRADRALYKVKWKGGLKNIDSSYKGLSSVNMRGYLNPNVEYSIFTSKRRVGSYAVKGWMSGK